MRMHINSHWKTHVYKSINYLLTHCFANFFESNDTVRDYNPRYNRNIQSTTNVSFLALNITDLESGMTLIYLGDTRHADISGRY